VHGPIFEVRCSGYGCRHQESVSRPPVYVYDLQGGLRCKTILLIIKFTARELDAALSLYY